MRLARYAPARPRLPCAGASTEPSPPASRGLARTRSLPVRAADIPACPLQATANRLMAGDPQALAAMRQAGAHGNPLALALIAQYERLRHPPPELLPPAQQRSVLAAARTAADADAGDPSGQFIYGQELWDIGYFHHDPTRLAAGKRWLTRAVPLLRHAAHGNACPALYQFWLANAYGGGDDMGTNMTKYVEWNR